MTDRFVLRPDRDGLSVMDIWTGEVAVIASVPLKTRGVASTLGPTQARLGPKWRLVSVRLTAPPSGPQTGLDLAQRQYFSGGAGR